MMIHHDERAVVKLAGLRRRAVPRRAVRPFKHVVWRSWLEDALQLTVVEASAGDNQCVSRRSAHGAGAYGGGGQG